LNPLHLALCVTAPRFPAWQHHAKGLSAIPDQKARIAQPYLFPRSLDSNYRCRESRQRQIALLLAELVAQRVNSFSSSRNFLRVLIYLCLLRSCAARHGTSRPDL